MNAIRLTNRLLCLAALGFAVGSSRADTIYVPDDHPEIQAAIDAADEGDTVIVRDGVYGGAGNKDLDLGGKGVTVRSENGAANCIIDCEYEYPGFHFQSGETEASVVQGFTIMHGDWNVGAGICVEYSSPTIKECVITENAAYVFGGGIGCYYASPIILDCTITENTAVAGGGIACDDFSDPLIINCRITSNHAEGGMSWGGGVLSDSYCNPLLVNCVIAGNTASSGGGGVVCNDVGYATIVNSTIAENSAGGGGGGALAIAQQDVFMANCILWGNTPDEISPGVGLLDVMYSDVAGGWPGDGNIDADPFFVDPAGGDFRLLSGSLCIDAADNDALPPDFLDLDGDGDMDEPFPYDIDGRSRRVDDPDMPDSGNPGWPGPPIVDMGACEFQVQGECEGDVDGDGDTDWSDLAILAHDWGCAYPDDCVGDLNGDGITDVYDLAILIQDWGCPDGDPSCDEGDSGALEVSATGVDNSYVQFGNDPLAPEFDGGVTHFTFDLQVQVEPGHDWGAAGMDWALTDPDGEFFLHPLGTGLPPDPGYFGDYPALEFDSYWCGASDIPPGGSGETTYVFFDTREPTELSAVWLDVFDTGEGTFTIARFTVVVPPESGIPAVVPAGTGGDAPVIGTISGWATNSSYEPGCVQVALDIILEDDCECSGDIDDDCDTDWSDLSILLADWGCMSDCVADLNGDGVTDTSDLGMLLADWGCPDGASSCDEPSGVMGVSVVAVDNTAVGTGDDSAEPAFDGGVTHFTFDLQVEVGPAEDWGAAEADAILSDPYVEFFTHSMNPTGAPPDSGLFGYYPALEFDSYWTAAAVIGPGQSGVAPQLHFAVRTAEELSALWFDIDDTGEGVFTIARITVVVPAGGRLPPTVVPAGTGGDMPVAGTIFGWVTNTSYNPGCAEIAFDILHCCPADVDGDCDTDQSDLGALLSAWGSRPGDGNWNANADFDGDNHVHQSDLGVLLANWRCGAAEP